MQEVYIGRDNYRISKKELDIMRKNMKKVPIISKKSDKYHKEQEKKANEFIESELEKI